MKGVYSSMRLCQPMPNISGAFSTGLAVNVDVANGIFWASQALHQAARNFCRDRNPRMDWLVFNRLLKPTKDSRIGWTMSPDFKELRKLVKLKFAVKHRGKDGSNKTYTIKGFHFDPKFGAEGAHSKNVTFKMKDGTTTSVYDYFQKQYNVELEFHYLPLVLTTKDGMFPMEVCTIMPNQRYVFKTSPEQTANMIKFAVTRPKQRIEAIQQGVKMLKWNEDPYFMHYGIEIDPSMTITNARLLPNPEIQYAGSKVNPGISGRWDLRGKKFLKANPSPLVSWGVAIMDNSTDNTTVQNFLKVFVNTYITHGGQVQNRQPVIHCAGKGELIPNVVTTLRNLILLFILRDKNSVTYERLKKSLDCRYGLVSQMMQSVHVQKAQPQYCSNVCMKLNAKLGGTTCKSVPTAASKGPPSFFKVPTLIIGADVSHPSPGSPQASMAAITMSMDKDACRYAAAVQTNGIRVEMIHDANLASMIIPLLENWIKNVGNGQGPQHIYYFRDGVSEGQYLHVLDEEVVNMRAAIKKKFGPVKIKFTVVIASKRHHIRIFPKENDSVAGDRNANPHPGTLVERDVTHPFEYDFYLNSHSAIQGTARPVHYHVLLDEMGVPANILQSMIYQHCYQYMRSTTPVSLHPAVYYAHLASNRARAHEDVASSEGPRGGQKFVEMVQAQAGKPRAVTVESDKITESKPLVELGSGASDEVKAAIKVSMWYI
ncbi:MAG: hypothetical protein M1818_000672 [Claussenomyces sp. TS43310]|nr:MAG: hypothetical protein M1818_000672 [Claussenomyces sp. TS43310]